MPLYFFDEIVGEDLIEDDEGIDMPDLESAKKEAIRGAREQIAAFAKLGIDGTDRQFRVRTLTGEVVLALRFGDTLQHD